MKLNLERLFVVVFTLFTQTESATTKRPDTNSPSNDGWRDFIRGSEFGDKIGIEIHSFFLKTGKCTGEMGHDAIYDIDRKTCRDCADDNCTNDAACRTQCSDLRRLSELEFDYRSLHARDDNLAQTMNYIIFGLIVVGIFVAVGYAYMIRKWYKSRYDKTEAPESDKIANERHPLQEGQHGAQ